MTTTKQSRVSPVDVPNLKQRDLMKCVICEKGMMHDRSITFYRVRIARYIVNTPAVIRQDGLERALYPASFLAGHMGPDEDMAVAVGPALEVHLCDSCAMQHCVASIGEIANED